MAGSDDWYEEPSSWDYIVTPAFLTSLILSIILPKLMVPLFKMVEPRYKNLPAKQLTHFNTLSSSTLHAVISSALAVYLLWSGLMEPNRVFSKTPLGFTAMQISYGYFIGDFIVSLFDPVLRSDAGSILHHIAGIVSITLGLFYQGKLMFYIVYRLISELSTPFVNLWWYHHQLGYKEGFGYLFASVVMVLSFLLVRIVPIPWHWYSLVQTLQIPQCSVVVPFHWRMYIVGVYILFDVLNVYWFYKMIKGALKLLSSSKKSS